MVEVACPFWGNNGSAFRVNMVVLQSQGLKFFETCSGLYRLIDADAEMHSEQSQTNCYTSIWAGDLMLVKMWPHHDGWRVELIGDWYERARAIEGTIKDTAERQGRTVSVINREENGTHRVMAFSPKERLSSRLVTEDGLDAEIDRAKSTPDVVRIEVWQRVRMIVSKVEWRDENG